MSEKKVHLFIAGEGDAELLAIIDKGLAEIGHQAIRSSIETGAESMLDSLGEDVVPVVVR
jgi:hypothetical protein